jgi:peptidylprolyl isomerase
MNSPLKRAGAIIGVIAVVAAAMFGAAIATPSASIGQETKPHLMLTLKDGVVDIELLNDVAPKQVERIIALTEAGTYDNVLFHRVIDGFMAQTGDVQYAKVGGPEFNPAYWGAGSSTLPDVPAEFSDIPYERGIVGAARSQDPNSANSQFFIMFTEYPSLNGLYTVFGRVASGMEFVDSIVKGEPPASPDMIISAKIEYK